MFDIDGTLVQSYDFDESCYISAVEEVTGIRVRNNWSTYPHVTDRGILMTFIERQAPHLKLITLEPQVKMSFSQKIDDHLYHSPSIAVDGANEFLARLKEDSRIAISIATGGWRETALKKLSSAGIDANGLVLSSSNDHHSRIKIMQLSAQKVHDTKVLPITYFGDAEWDVRACEELNVNLVIIGNRVTHSQGMPDFTNYNRAIDFIVNC